MLTSTLVFCLLIVGTLAQFPGASQDCYDTSLGGTQGFCEAVDCCADGNYASGLCLDYPADVSQGLRASADTLEVGIEYTYTL